MKKELKKDLSRRNLPVFSQRIKDRREELGLTQLELARLVWADLLKNADEKTVDTKRKCIVGYENGKQPKDNADYISLCNALGCDMGYLFGENECRTRDLQGVSDYLGLSEKAVERIRNLNSEYHVFSSYLESLLLSDNFSLSLEYAAAAINPPIMSEEESLDMFKGVLQVLNRDPVEEEPIHVAQLKQIFAHTNTVDDLNRLIVLLSEYSSSHVLLDKEEYRNFQLQQSSILFRKAIEDIIP